MVSYPRQMKSCVINCLLLMFAILSWTPTNMAEKEVATDCYQ